MSNVILPNFQITNIPEVDANFNVLYQIILELQAELDSKVGK